MDIIEFQTTVKNGMIEIPLEYQGKVKDRVRVILVPEHKHSRQRNLIDRLLKKPLQARDFQPLSRDEILGG